MTMVGETLRRERLKRNLDFEQISRELKISRRFLEAIENDQFEKLPGGVFAKSFVRQYARLLGLDEDELAGQLQSALAPVPETPQFVEKVKPASIAPIQVPKVEEWRTVGDTGFRWSGSLSAAVMVVVAMLVCSAVYAWLQRPKSAAINQSAAPVQHVTAPVPAPIPAPVQAAPPVVAPPQAPVAEAGQTVADPKAAETKAGEVKPAEPKPAGA